MYFKFLWFVSVLTWRLTQLYSIVLSTEKAETSPGSTYISNVGTFRVPVKCSSNRKGLRSYHLGGKSMNFKEFRSNFDWKLFRKSSVKLQTEYKRALEKVTAQLVMLVLHFRFPYEGCFKGTLFKTYLGLLPPSFPDLTFLHWWWFNNETIFSVFRMHNERHR